MFRSCWEGEGGVNFFVERWKVTAGAEPFEAQGKQVPPLRTDGVVGLGGLI
jgi:hypothetical protein